MSNHSDDMLGDSYTNLLANAGLYDEIEAEFEESEMKDGALPRLQESTPEPPAAVVATLREPLATVSTTSGESEESAVGIPISNRDRFMIASTLLGLPRAGETQVMHWINGITANDMVEPGLGQASSSSPFSPFQKVPRPITEVEMDRFAKELNGFVFVFGCPAAGKGTLLGRLAQDPELAHAHLYHLSVGDYLRELRANGTLPAFASQDLAQQNLISGATLVALIKTKVSREWRRGARIFLLDGFPRNSEQMPAFLDKHICSLAIHIDTRYALAKMRYLARRGRPGDNAALFQQRYDEFQRHNAELIAPFDEEGKLVTIGTEDTNHTDPEMMYEGFKAVLKGHHIGAQLFVPDRVAR